MGTTEAEKAFIKAYDEHADALFRFCLMKISDREKALDMVQETFTRTWQCVARGDSIQNLKSFLFKVASNIIIDEYRRKKADSLDELREEIGFDPDDDSDTNGTNRLAETNEAVAVIQRLPEPYRDVLTLRYVSDLSIGEIAETLDETENAVSVRLNRAMKKLREIMKVNIEH